MNKVLMITALTIAPSGCRMDNESKQKSISTIHHDGLCFVVYNTFDGTAMVQVECGSLKEEDE